jgi:hypothetical protein
VPPPEADTIVASPSPRKRSPEIRIEAAPGHRTDRFDVAWPVRSPDHVALVLGSGGKHVKRQSLAPGMSAMARWKPLLSISAAMKATLRLKCWGFGTRTMALCLLASAIAAANCRRSPRDRLGFLEGYYRSRCGGGNALAKCWMVTLGST